MPPFLTIQLVVALAGVPLLATWPPAQGPILIVPVASRASDGMAARALDAGARLLAPGPLPGSFVVDGERARLRALPGTLLFSAASVGCGPAR